MTIWQTETVAWGAHLRVSGLAQTSVELRTGHVSTMGRRLGGDPWERSADELLEYLARYSGHTLRSVTTSVARFYAWGAKTGRVAADPVSGMVKVASRPSPRPRPAPEAAYAAALLAADPRTRLMLRLAAELGLRRGEVARVHADDVVQDLLGRSLVVHGKGGRQRVLPMTDDLAEAVLRRSGGGWAFPSPQGDHLSAQWVGDVVGRALPAGLTMHTLRHRFATRAYLVNRDLPVVQQLLGHASPSTTMHYVAVPGDALRATVLAIAS